jgi:hypothetical protein
VLVFGVLLRRVAVSIIVSLFRDVDMFEDLAGLLG